MKSTTKVWFFLLFFCFSFVYLGAKFGGRLGLLIGFIISVCFLVLCLFSEHNSVLKKLNAQELSGQDAWNLNDQVSKWSKILLIKKPKVFLVPSMTATAFSTGSPWGGSSIAFSEGLLKKLSQEEAEAILVHQLCHIARMDSFAFGVASTIANSILTLAYFLDQIWLLQKVPFCKKMLKNQKPFQLILTPLAWFLIRMKVRQQTYFENDDLASQLLPNPKILAEALWKLESLNQARPLDIPACSSHLFVVNPRGLRETHWFYLTHPKINLRIRRMIGFEPL